MQSATIADIIAMDIYICTNFLVIFIIGHMKELRADYF